MADDIRVNITFNDFPRLIKESPQECGRRVTKLAHLGRNYAVTSIQRGGAGRSTPGEPPKTDTGALVNSITVENIGSFERSINVGVDYGPHLEYGTRRMAARPFMGPMALWLETQIEPMFQDLFSRWGGGDGGGE